MQTIIINKSSDDTRAYLESRPEICGRGRNISEAIGEMITDHLEEFDVKVSWADEDEGAGNHE